MTIRAALGIDLGTSGVKTALLDEAGEVVGAASREYPVASPHPGWAETDPALWERAAREAVADVVTRSPDVEVVAVGLAGQMHGTVLVDGDHEAVRPAVLWPDSRAAGQMPRWQALPDGLRRGLANPLTPGMPGPVLGWLAEHEPESVARATAFVLPKDWLRSRLVPVAPCTDASDASASLLWDLPGDSWSTDVADLAGVPTRLLPPLRASGDSVGPLAATAARAWGLPVGIPVSVGAGDVAATILGLDAEDGRLVLTVGTGAQLVLPGVDRGTTAPDRHHLYRDAGDGWFALGAVMNGGLALGRVVELLGATWDDLYRDHRPDASLPGFVPWFTGERLMGGVDGGGAGWFDVGLGTTRADLLAAALEGVAFTIRRVFEAMPPSAEVVDLVGGGARSPVFNQLLADVLQRPLHRLEQRDATVVGAARLGWRALGEQPALTLVRGHEPLTPRVSEELDARYARFLGHAASVSGSLNGP